MADKVKMTDRERDIAAQIRGVCSQIIDPVDGINARKDEVSVLNEGLVTTKLSIMAQVAEMSSADRWLPGEIKNATAYAAKMGNSNPDDPRSEKSLATFLSEMNAVAHPKVRDRFPTLLQAVEDAWAAETEAKALDDDEPTPVRKWASRKYHAIMQVMRAVKNDNAEIMSADDVVRYAKENDPDFNPERVAKRLESVAKTLQGIFVDFANEEVGHAHRYIETITTEDLIKSMKVKIAKEHAAAKAAAKSQSQAATPVVTSVSTTPAPEPAPAAIEPAEGVVDVIDDVLNDNLQLIEELAA